MSEDTKKKISKENTVPAAGRALTPEELQRDLEFFKKRYLQTAKDYAELKTRYAELEIAYTSTVQSTAWKITKPLRWIGNCLVRLFKGRRVTKLAYKGLASLKNDGVRATMFRIKHRHQSRVGAAGYMYEHQISEAEKKEQRETDFNRVLKFSVIVPLYNTPIEYLNEMIQSVIDQTYSDWELCLADGSDEDHKEVEKVCLEYTKKDKRIRYKKLEKNDGISGNTNACMDMATGQYISLLDHDDVLHPSALYETMNAIVLENADLIYTDEMVFKDSVENVEMIHFKPDFSIDTLRSHNYFCHFTSFSVELQKQVGYFSKEHNGSQDYDMFLRLCEKARHVSHVAKVMYYWRNHPDSVASDLSVKPYCITSAKKALADHLDRMGLEGEVTDSTVASTYRIKYAIQGNPKVSIIIPNKDYISDLETCINSIFERSTYTNFEIVIVENNSEEKETFEYYKQLESTHKNVKVIRWTGIFNYSAINNFGFSHTTGEYILLLNNDIEVITPGWMEEMIMYIQRDDVGAVGAKLYYPDNTVQHAGVIVGLGGVAGHSHKGYDRSSSGYIHRLTLAQNLSAVTAACLMTKRSVWEQVSGLDEKFEVAFNDVDFCLRIRKAGYLIVFTPYAELYHYESKSRGYENTPEKIARFEGEKKKFGDRWGGFLAKGDPYYNVNLTLAREDFSIG